MKSALPSKLAVVPILLVVGVSSCSPQASPAPALISVIAQFSWFHRAEFAGFYAADRLGYFTEEGLAVSFVEAGPNIDFVGPVATGQAQFGVAQPPDLILARGAGKPVRSIAVIYRRSPIVFISHADPGITWPQDLVGEKNRSAITVYAVQFREEIYRK
jgi:NitT/TauT family transport system substrate-binding protein